MIDLIFSILFGMILVFALIIVPLVMFSVIDSMVELTFDFSLKNYLKEKFRKE